MEPSEDEAFKVAGLLVDPLFAAAVAVSSPASSL